MAPESKGAETRARLIAAAAETLIQGEGNFEMSRLARRARVSNCLPYHCEPSAESSCLRDQRRPNPRAAIGRPVRWSPSNKPP